MGDDWQWQQDWARVDDVPGAVSAWAHHGLAIASNGDVVGFHARQLVRFGGDGSVLAVSTTPLFEGHQLTMVRDGGVESVWVADPGVCLHQDPDGNIDHGLMLVGGPGRAVRMALDGTILQEIPRPPLSEGVFYLPTSVAVDEVDRGGSGNIWVADGYGSSLVHWYDRDGELIGELDGTSGAGRFACPHAVFVDRRGNVPEVYIADRGNARVQVFDLDGVFLRSFGDGVLTSPSSFAAWGDSLVIAELNARLAIFDATDQLVEYVGDNSAVVDLPGWPNSYDHHDNVVRSRSLRAESFNSPHAVAVDDHGALFVAEWLVGGRYTKLTRRTETP